MRPSTLAVAIGFLLLGCGATGMSMAGHTSTPKAPPASNVPVPLGQAVQTPSTWATTTAQPPVSITIPAIGVDAKIIHLGITKSGALQVPSTVTVAGWYVNSPRPGAVGSAVIAGHVDSYASAGVFYRLHNLRPGDQIYVKEQGGKLATFKVNSVHQYLKARFPTSIVYGPAPTPQLRLITCGGSFDSSTGHYLSNVIVYATLA